MNTTKQTTEQKIDFTYSQNIIEFLKQINSTIIFSTYKSGKLMLIGQNNDQFDIRYKEFPRPMGMYANGGTLWAGLGHGIWRFANYASAAEKLDGPYDACYLPQSIHFTADIDIHEMEM